MTFARKPGRIVVLTCGALLICTGCGDDSGNKSKGQQAQPTTSEVQPEPSAGSPSEAKTDEMKETDTETPLAPATKLAERVQSIVEAYGQGNDVQSAAGDWKAPTDDSEFAQVAKNFQKATQKRGAEEFRVEAMSLKIGFPKGESGGKEARTKKGQLLSGLLLTGSSEPAFAAVRTESTFSGTTPLGEVPDNAPDVKALGESVVAALKDPKTCKSLPIAKPEHIKDSLPDVPKTDHLLKANKKAGETLKKFCDSISDTSKLGTPEIEVDEFVVVGLDSEGAKVGHLEFGLKETDDDKLAIARWPESFARTPGGGAKKKAKRVK